MTSLILASSSKARRVLLAGAGLSFAAVPADVDEAALIKAQDGIEAGAMAAMLAAAKALRVAADHPQALVVGADQVLTCYGRLFQKAATRNEARANLEWLNGRVHELISAVCVAQGRDILWAYRDVATLTMKRHDAAFIGRYLEAAGEAVLHAVGGYELEGRGAWLFDKIDGDYFTILGLPLLPLLDFLATRGFGPTGAA